MRQSHQACPDCDGIDRRDFLQVAALTAAGTVWALPKASAAPSPSSAAETAVKALYGTLTDAQKKVMCFDWDYQHPKRGLLRTHVCNLWQITPPTVSSSFYTKDQQALVFDVFKGMFNPDWHERIQKQLKDDTGKPFGGAQSIAIFGTPGSGKFEMVMTSRHFTVRCDGDSESHVALGGPIFHGHAATGYTEKVGHPGNVFWHQAKMANQLYQVLDGKQQEKALQPRRPAEGSVAFRGPDGKFPGLTCSDMSKDQKDALQKILLSLIEPYRKEDADEVLDCLKKMGGLDKCSLAFYKDGNLGDNEWDNWRLEGPAFVWYFRGTPHVHIWVNVADSPEVKLNAFVDGPAAKE